MSGGERWQKKCLVRQRCEGDYRRNQKNWRGRRKEDDVNKIGRCKAKIVNNGKKDKLERQEKNDHGGLDMGERDGGWKKQQGGKRGTGKEFGCGKIKTEEQWWR